MQGAISYLKIDGIPYFKVPHSRGCEILKPESSARRFDPLVEHNPFHCHRSITPQKLKEMEEILGNEDIKVES